MMLMMLLTPAVGLLCLSMGVLCRDRSDRAVCMATGCVLAYVGVYLQGYYTGEILLPELLTWFISAPTPEYLPPF